MVMATYHAMVQKNVIPEYCADVVTLFEFFFFFQAEDGIRDLTVTGVQTCALPISSVTSATTSRNRSSDGRKSATRRSSQTALTASRVFPSAIPAAPATGTLAVQLSRNAPIAMPGQ